MKNHVLKASSHGYTLPFIYMFHLFNVNHSYLRFDCNYMKMRKLLFSVGKRFKIRNEDSFEGILENIEKTNSANIQPEILVPQKHSLLKNAAYFITNNINGITFHLT